MRFICAIPNLNSFYLINAVERVGGDHVLISYAMVADEHEKFQDYIRGGAKAVKRVDRGRRIV